MKAHHFALAAAIVASAACNAEKGADANANAPITAAVVKPPQGGDWTEVVSMTPAGGYVMGNPEAKVKLIEFGSMTCPHCREFDEQGVPALIDKYVKTGQVSWEFRNYVRDPFDVAASLIARCGGEKTFFPLTRALYKDQPNWIGKLQTVPQDQLQALQNVGPERQFSEIAKLAGFQQWAAMRGVPTAKSSSCLTNQAEIDKLVQMTGDASTQFPNFPGTPTFIINGEMAEQTATWELLEPKLRAALR
jgi:protein-disulfide isomerase